MTIAAFEMFSLVEWIIFGFIGANMSIAATCVLHRGVKRIAEPRAK